MRDDEEIDTEQRLRLQQLSKEDAYLKGYIKGQDSIREKFKSEIRKVKEIRDHYDEILHDPGKLAALAKLNPKVESAVILAVMALVLEEEDAT